MNPIRIFLAVICAALLIAAPAQGKGFSSSSKSSSSSSSKSSGGSKSSTKSTSSSTKVASSSKPSTGSKPAPPVTKTIPVAPRITPPVRTSTGVAVSKVSIPAGRSYSADRNQVVNGSFRDRSGNTHRYYDPYDYRTSYGAPIYYGAYDSPFFYMWLFSMNDDNRSNDPLPPSADGKISESLLSYAQVIKGELDLISAKAEDAS